MSSSSVFDSCLNSITWYHTCKMERSRLGGTTAVIRLSQWLNHAGPGPGGNVVPFVVRMPTVLAGKDAKS